MSMTLYNTNIKSNQAGKLLGLPMDNLLNVDEDMLREYFVDAQDKVLSKSFILKNILLNNYQYVLRPISAQENQKLI